MFSISEVSEIHYRSRSRKLRPFAFLFYFLSLSRELASAARPSEEARRMFSPSQARGWDNRFRDDSDEYDSENDDEPGPFMERKAPRRTTQLVASTGTRGTNLELAPGSSMRDALPRSASIHNLNITSPIPTEHHLGDNAGQGRPTSR